MRRAELLQWLNRSERRQHILITLKQPMTSKQICRQIDMSLDCCSYVLKELQFNKLVYCLNQQSRRSRLYWLTDLGKKCRKDLFKERDFNKTEENIPKLDWDLYGWVCFNHRTAVVQTLVEPMQPAAIKRRLRLQKPQVRISANNVRDIIKLLLQRGIVQPVKIRRKAHLRYELTELGKRLRRLLIQAEHQIFF